MAWALGLLQLMGWMEDFYISTGFDSWKWDVLCLLNVRLALNYYIVFK